MPSRTAFHGVQSASELVDMSTVQTITQSAVGSAPAKLTVLPSAEDNKTEEREEYRYAHLLPVFPQDEHYRPLTPFDHGDPASRALSHPNPRAFLDNATSVVQLTPHLGEVVTGVNLATLDNEGRDQVALEVAKRGVVAFRDQQDFIDRGPDFYLEWGRYFGRLHIHPTSGHPVNYPELHLVYRDENSTFNFERSNSISSTGWHSDVSYELQPPGLTALFLFSQPSTGGDTSFTSQVAALKKLSPQFVAFLKTLKAVHSGFEQAEYSRSGRRGGVVRREPVKHVHPIVRRHPVTGEEALYVNRQFTRYIVGLKIEESNAILNLLYDHIDRSADVQARVKWEPYTVVLWDNRITAHTAIVDYLDTKQRRHGARITPQAERPIPALEGLDLSE
ncbi:Alpha-ketoglutarate-dependent sulfonate dioxygenase [Sparassis crispa]|uniref:Alpha-ketoglutarate-dependent sulfonate dioxygenase n=1 Tax=Sparassis crispa TaxID=139825 RepID=A0A401G8F6_9APHY|nr:Alpha-ketoglutarate-dependent sulfonate dioxygenase [Sparassis crispa]GBE78429.1 Alpha-ketoglutarate-dependent sulfonate dioxygenase [Sparassis crispa]